MGGYEMLGPRWLTTVRLALPLAIAACVSYPHVAWAWGAEGHRIVAMIAMNHLTPGARAKLSDLLTASGTSLVAGTHVAAGGFRNLADLSTWADAFRNQNRATAGWHFADIPKAELSYDDARDCGDGNCVVIKLAYYTKVLGDTTAPLADRAVALRFVVHLTGDIHQPLHCADNDDRGGNSVTETYGGQASNLHHVWDTDVLLADGGGDQPTLATKLDTATSASTAIDWSTGTPVDWANEAHTLAVETAYGALPLSSDEDLSGAYAAKATPVIEAQLEKAGLRLAMILNGALK